MKILIAGGGTQGVSCGDSLRKEHEVGIVAANLMVRKSHFFSHVYTDVRSMDDSLFELLAREQFDVLIPVTDMATTFVSKNKTHIEQDYGVKCGVPDYELVYQVEDKSRFMHFCEENDIPHPRTMPVEMQNIPEAARTIGFPSLIKPDYSVGARGITKVTNDMELEALLPSIIQKYGTCTLQEFIDNRDYYYNVMLYRDSQGNQVAHTILKIVRMYPIGAGSSSCCITVENEELLRICTNCLDKLGWVGMADFDVLQRTDNGEYKIIEINPRVPASLRAASVSGVNFPMIIACDTMEMKSPVFNYSPGKVLRYLGIDLMWWLKSSRRFSTNPHWLHFIGRDVYYQDIYRNDFSTWWTWFVEGVGKISKKNKKLRN